MGIRTAGAAYKIQKVELEQNLIILSKTGLNINF